jgi:hypothetical protein
VNALGNHAKTTARFPRSSAKRCIWPSEPGSAKSGAALPTSRDTAAPGAELPRSVFVASEPDGDPHAAHIRTDGSATASKRMGFTYHGLDLRTAEETDFTTGETHHPRLLLHRRCYVGNTIRFPQRLSNDGFPRRGLARTRYAQDALVSRLSRWPGHRSSTAARNLGGMSPRDRVELADRGDGATLATRRRGGTRGRGRSARR